MENENGELMTAGEVFRQYKDKIIDIFLPFKESGSFKDLRLFGSVHEGTDRSDSDIDLLVSKGPNYSWEAHRDLVAAYCDYAFNVQVSVEENIFFKVEDYEPLC